MGSRVCVMNAGRVVQIGSPLEVYWNPADMFVARFLGAPPMNLMELPVSAAGDRFTAGDNHANLPLTSWRPETLASYAGKRVAAGVRAEDLRLGQPPGPGDTGWITGQVDAVEPLGAETLVLVSTRTGFEVTARLGRDVAARVGDIVTLSFDAAAVHLFDPASTHAIAKEF